MAAIVFGRSVTQKCTFEKRFDSNGKVWMQTAAHDALTALTIYKIIADEFGSITAAQADDQDLVYLGAPENAVASGVVEWLQIGGYIASMVTPALDVEIGHALKMHNGAIADVGADFTGAAAEFACNTIAAGSVSVHTVILYPERILATT